MAASNTQPAHIAIVGGGFTGLVCARNLLLAGYRVTVLEAQPELGGLAGSFNFGPFHWDRFYHCILTSDQSLLALLDDLGLSKQLRWTATEVGFFSHGKLYKMTSPRDLLRFPHLSLANKLRLGIATLYASHLRDGERLEHIPLETWTRQLFGARIYREMWEPLFRCKLGEMRHHASAAFLWGTLRRLYSTREKGPAKQEKLGYVEGGYGAVFARLQQQVTELGATIRTGVKIRSVSSMGARSGAPGKRVLLSDLREMMHFDGAILTLPNRAVAACLATSDTAYRTRLAHVRYLGLICFVLLLRRRLSPFYVTNITEQSPFTGIIEMTNLIDPKQETAGLHLVYLPRYTSSDDPLFEANDAEVWQRFRPELQRIHPDLSEDHIAARFLFRERTVQPVPTLGYSRIAPPPETPVPGVYLANTAQILNNTLNNNVMTELAHAACACLMRDIPTGTQTRPRTGASADAVCQLPPRQGEPCQPV
jgi:protoporphyrinogen oxidase